jgi:hypothetical protein
MAQDGAKAGTTGDGEGDDGVLPQVGEGPEGEGGREAGPAEPSDLLAIAEATAKHLRTRPLTEEEQLKLMKEHEPIPVGVMGWCAKVGSYFTDKQKTKLKAGMRVRGQIVGTGTVRGKFGVQQYVTIAGRYSCPKHVNAQGEVRDAVDGLGRWLLAIDSTLTELPQHVGAVVDVELEKRGGGGVRHTYKRVDIYVQ